MRLGSVPYLNARPLVAWFAESAPAEVTLSYATPAVLIEQLQAGEIDVAMASTFAMFAHPELSLCPGLGVTATGPAWSVRLFSRVPFADIRTLALDACSRSSNALAQVVLADAYGVTPRTTLQVPAIEPMLASADAAVLIGDIGLLERGADGLRILDLGTAWWELTGLPFYFAGWMARDADVLERATPMLQVACAYGVAHLEAIAAAEAVRLGASYDLCYRYLTEVMRYEAGSQEEAGLAEFHHRVRRLGLLQV